MMSRTLTKIAVGFYWLLLIVTAIAVPPASSQGGSPFLQRILDEIANLQTSVNNLPPTWHNILPADQRFVLVMGEEGVLDRETGLVWERSPGTGVFSWAIARDVCPGKSVGGRKGWRLPSAHELASLVDPTVFPGPTLPTGHPLTNVQSYDYWSATMDADAPWRAWRVTFSNAGVTATDKSSGQFVWCVRGGMNADAY